MAHGTTERGQDTGVLRVAFLGPEGTYSHQVAFDRFHESATYVEKNSIAGAFSAVPVEASLSIIPIENSIFGSVVETCDLLRDPEVGKGKFVREEIVLQVQHCLLAVHGTKLQDIKRVLSHEQALGQCSNFLREHLPKATLVKVPSTAAAASAILAADMAADSAAICSQVCTSVYRGLELLFKGIQNENNNFTKFWILSDSLTHPIPGSLTPDSPKHALLRVSHSFSAVASRSPDLTALMTGLGLHVIRLDRRPSAEAIAFHDVYFLEVERTCSADGVEEPRGPNGTANVKEGRTWMEEVGEAVERVRGLDWNAYTLGIW
ncbi:hypothetical protein M0805_004319 [Coniferiporia weirii]|nr:hypothetical protein M0805_004319 [Coniferiporia weirii]